MSLVRIALARVPQPLRPLIIKHRELVKFALVGGTCYVITLVINYALKLTVLETHPVIALTIATTFATGVSYVLNREWSFRTRGGRKRHHEAVLFLVISALAVVVNDIPLYIARDVFHFQVPAVSRFVQEFSDFTTGMVIGTLLAMAFRWWAFRRFVFPAKKVKTRRLAATEPETAGSRSVSESAERRPQSVP